MVFHQGSELIINTNCYTVLNSAYEVDYKHITSHLWGCLKMPFSTYNGMFSHSRREQERATCETEGKKTESGGYHLICGIAVAFIVFGETVPKEYSEVSNLTVQKQLEESLLDVANYWYRLSAKTQ